MGIYLYGSVIVGGLQKYSDIDLFVVTLAADIKDDTRNVLLTLARIWSTLETDTIRSIPDAANWVIERLPEIHQVVMNRAKFICIGHEDEYWEDLKESIEACAGWMIQ